MKVLLSIRPEFVEKILNGSKKFEFRKNSFKKSGVKTVVIYSTMPVGKVVGEFDIEEVLMRRPSELWAITSRHSGITKCFFDSYYEGKNTGVALKVGNVREYEVPLPLNSLGSNMKAPQSFRYLN